MSGGKRKAGTQKKNLKYVKQKARTEENRKKRQLRHKELYGV